MTSGTQAATKRVDSTEHQAAARRRFGTTDLIVSPIGLGCARIGGVFQGDAKRLVSLIDAAADAGIEFFDTADMYSQGESESLLGRALRRRRERVTIASKVGYVLPAQRRLAGRIKPLLRPLIRTLGLKRTSLPAGLRGEPTQNFSAAYIRRAVEGSLRRLRTDRIDLLQLHSPPAETIRNGEWSEALAALRADGKVRYYGIACDTVADAFAALERPGVASVQVTLSLLERDAATALIPEAARRGIGVIARECLANGLLAKAPSEIAPTSFNSAEEAERRLSQIGFYRSLADEQGMELPAFALKYASSMPGVSVALAGMRTQSHLDDLLRWLRAPNVDASVYEKHPRERG
jgi:aryl-alcohol dehydrogenase-like predicted oxidoreductase